MFLVCTVRVWRFSEADEVCPPHTMPLPEGQRSEIPAAWADCETLAVPSHTSRLVALLSCVPGLQSICGKTIEVVKIPTSGQFTREAVLELRGN